MSACHADTGALRRQQGVVGFLHLALLTLMVLCMVLALDAGRLYHERQNLQRIADLVALETTARAGVVATADAGRLVAGAWDSAARNGFAAAEDGEHSLALETGRVELDAATRRFDPGASRDLHDAVRVHLTRSVRTSLAGNLAALVPGLDLPARTRLQATAVARRTLQPAFSVGSTLLTADTGASPLLGPLLRELLGGDVDLSVLGFEALAHAGVTLRELVDASMNVAELEADTLGELLGLDLTALQLVELTLEALTRRAADEHALLDTQIQALQGLADVLLAAPAGALQEGIRLGDLLVIDVLDPETAGQLLGAELGVGELLNGALLLAHEGNVLTVEGLEIGSQGVVGVSPVTVDLDLIVGAAPQIVIGPAGCSSGHQPPCMGAWRTEARTAQLQLDTRLTLDLLQLVTLQLDVDLASTGGAAGIEAIRSVPGGGYALDVAGAGSVLELALAADLSLLDGFGGLLNLTLDTDSASSVEQLGGGSAFGELRWPEADAITLSPSGTAALFDEIDALLSNLDIGLTLGPDAEQESCHWLDLGCHVGSALDTLLGPVLDIVNDLVLGPAVESVEDLLGVLNSLLGSLTGELLQPVLEPLLEALGIDLVELQVDVHDVRAGSVELVQ